MLVVKNLTKTFGNTVAVDDISFEVPKSSIFGIIGQNGSGKTTLFRLILNFLTSENDGAVYWNGEPANYRELENKLGYLPEERGLYEDLSIHNQLKFFAELKDFRPDNIDDLIVDWMDRFKVKGELTDKVKSLSKGNQQKVQVITTLMHQPELIILDEPFSGLDPVNSDLLKKEIFKLRGQGACIIFSSHNMANVEELCDSLLMIHHGQPVLSGTVEEVRMINGRTRLYIETADWEKEHLMDLPGVTEVRQQDDHRFLLILEDQSYGPELFDTISKGNYLPRFHQTTPSLEEIFKWKVGESLE